MAAAYPGFAGDWEAAAVTFAAAGLIAWAGTGTVLHLLRRHEILDRPNERSSHVVATPRGGGIAVVGAILVAVALLADDLPWLVLAAVAALAAVSWIDDLRGLPPLPRFLFQGLVVLAVVFLAPWDGLVFQGLLPVALDRLLAAGVLLYFLNIFNFMDGIDGITGVETVCIGLGLALAGVVSEGNTLLAVAATAAALGFLVWNWQPARIFMGDVGSVPLGFLLGWLLLSAAAAGAWPVALLLPAYYLADASLTLLRRAARGERVWRAHREHFYQRAVQGGLSHAAVSRSVLACGLGLVAIAAADTWLPVPTLLALFAGAVLVLGLLWYLRRAAARSGHDAR
mgnify:CR=1 FL=1